jgi:hypothetical protein
MERLKELDVHLQDKIYNYYWERIFYTDLIKPLKETKIQIHKMILFVRRYIMHNMYSSLFNYKFELFQYNLVLKKIYKDKGLQLYLKTEFPILEQIFRNVNIDVAKNISIRYRYIFLYVLLTSGAMRYYVYEKFSRLDMLH